MLKMVAFDLDGTVCNTIPLCIETFLVALAPYTDYELTDKDIINSFGLNETGMVKKLVSNNWKSALNDFYFYYDKFHKKCTEPYTGIRELIKWLKKNNIMVSLITGKGEKSCKITLNKIGMEEEFQEMLYGSEKNFNKSQSIQKLLRKYNLKKSELIYIGDALSDIAACDKVGIICLSAAWDENSDWRKLEKANPKHIFKSIHELKLYIQQTL